jgi:mercuric ion transport protein
MNMLKSTGWFLVALVTCPCHLLLLIPLLAGTALGAYLAEYQTITFVVLGILFALSLYMGWRKLDQSEKTET